MFSSQGVIAKNSYVYRAWEAGNSRNKLQKNELSVNIELIIDAVLNTSMNFQSIAMCTLGIVRIHHGKTNVLLLDCKKTSEYARCINLNKHETFPIDVPISISNVHHMEQLMEGESCYSQNDIHIGTTTRNKITLVDPLPMPKFILSDYEDFGNEGVIDFDESGYEQFCNIIHTDGHGHELMNDKSIELLEIEKKGNVSNRNMDIEKSHSIIKDRGSEISCYMDDYDTMEGSEYWVYETNKEESELGSLKSYSSNVKGRNKRKRRSIIDERIVISQTKIRENMNNFRDIVLDDPDIAPPTKRLMKIRKDSSWDVLVTNCLVDGIKSTNSIPARFINRICTEAFSMNNSAISGFSSKMGEVLDMLQDENISCLDYDKNVRKWLCEDKTLANMSNEPIVGVCDEEMDIDSFVDCDFDENDNLQENGSLDIIKTAIHCPYEKRAKGQDKILRIVRQNESSSIKLFSLLSYLYGDIKQIDSQQAAKVFMCILEMTKTNIIEVSQCGPYENISISIKE